MCELLYLASDRLRTEQIMTTIHKRIEYLGEPKHGKGTLHGRSNHIQRENDHTTSGKC